MLTKRSAIVLLVGLNLLLLAALVIGSYSPPMAYAQAGRQAGGFVCVTAEVAGSTHNVLYVLDVSGRKLHAFFPTGGRGAALDPCPPRDLLEDFGRN